ncbi:MAG TPA: FHA domain-containing protein [Anaerolineales bacterium]|jgi:pSer/pThr/pTyr-binding forkhead associated (FHA) protein|nr:FHA domain-containing protein [Anaerolineales bacterium]
MIATVVLVLRFALSIALYVFLGWALWTLWRELDQQGKALADQKKPRISLRYKPEWGNDRVLSFQQTEIIIGRHAQCDVSLMDETLSAQHARITYHHRQWWLEDLNSTNGTSLNEHPLTTPTVIISDDEFKCGNVAFVIRIDTEETTSTQ